MEIRGLSERMEEAYSNFLMQQDESLLYQSIKYKRFLENLLDAKSCYRVCLENNEIKGIMPLMEKDGTFGKVINSLPFFGSNGGIIAPNSSAYSALKEEYQRLVRRDVAASTVVENPFSSRDNLGIHCDYNDRRIAQWTDISYQPGIEDQLLQAFDSSTRRNIRKAEKSEITVKIDNDCLEYIENEHRRNIQKIKGKIKPGKFFDILGQHFAAGEDYNIYVAQMDGRPIAGLLLFYYNKTVEYYIPVIHEEYRTYQPLARIIFLAMVEASRKGYKRWNWGGTWYSQEGVYRFKTKWATKEKMYRYYTEIYNRDLLNASPAELEREYDYFYVLPYNVLNERKKFDE